MYRLSRPALSLGVAGWLVLAAATPSEATPIFLPIFTALVGAFGVSTAAGTIGASIASALAGLATTALGIGLSLLLAPKPPKPENGVQSVQSPIANRAYAYGRVRVAGTMVLCEEYAGHLVYAAALLGHEIAAFVGIYLNDDLLTLTADGLPNDWLPGGDPRYGGKHVGIWSRRGTVPETAYETLTALVPTIWTSNHRGDGVASTAAIFYAVQQKNFTMIYPYGRPQPSRIVDAYKVYDWRDPDQSVTDPGTWKWSDNSVLAVAHFRCFSEFGPKKSFARAILPVLDVWTEEANRCDDLVAKKGGGTEKRYRLGGWTTTEQDDRSTLKTLLDTCDGWHVVRGDGSEIIDIGLYREPEIVITDADIRGFMIQTDVPDEDSANSFKATYTSPGHGYTTVDTSTFEWNEDQLARGKTNPTTVDLTWVQWIGQASRILKRASLRARQPIRGRLDLLLSGLDACYTRRIRVRSNTIPFLSDAVIENRRPVISLLTGGCSIEFVIAGAEIDAYDATSDERAAPMVPTRPATVGPPIPAPVNAVAYQSAATGSVTIAVDVTFDTPLSTAGGAAGLYNTSLGYVVQWRIHDIGGGVPGGWTEVRFTNVDATHPSITLTLGVVAAETSIDVEVASIASGGTPSGWSTTQTVSTAASSAAPGSPTLLSAAGGSGSASLSAKAPNSPNFRAMRFYRGASGAGFGSAVAIGSLIYGAANQTLSLTDTVGAGTYDYWAVAFSAAGIGSTPAGPATATVA